MELYFFRSFIEGAALEERNGYLVCSIHSKCQPAQLTGRKRRNAATLLGIIQRQVQPSSILQTDQWVSYRQIQRKPGLNHRTVNNSLHFVDPATGDKAIGRQQKKS